MKLIALSHHKEHMNLFKQDKGEFPSGKKFHAKIHQNWCVSHDFDSQQLQNKSAPFRYNCPQIKYVMDIHAECIWPQSCSFSDQDWAKHKQ